MRHTASKGRKARKWFINPIAGSPTRRWVLIVVAMMGGVVLAAAVRGYTRGAGLVRGALVEDVTAASLAGPRSETAMLQQGPPSDRIEVELITLTPDGIQPAAITRPKGRFLIALENRSGLKEVSLRFDREAANRSIEAPLISAPMHNGRLNLKYPTDLLPGTYLLTEASHPDWVCRFTITAR